VTNGNRADGIGKQTKGDEHESESDFGYFYATVSLPI